MKIDETLSTIVTRYNNGFLSPFEFFDLINERMERYPEHLKLVISSGVYYLLEDGHCYQLTDWPKIKLMEVSRWQ